MIFRPLDKNVIGSSRHAYLIGIGGVGMSALARILKHRGLKVSGSDLRDSESVQSLLQDGIQVYLGQKDLHFESVDLVIYSSAIPTDHFELKSAAQQGLRIYHRAEVLASLFNQAETSVAVTGTHGKTTTSSMVSFVLSELGRKPTCLVGGDVLNFQTNAVLGNEGIVVAEVDESDRSHEFYQPNYAILTNLEQDHVENYPKLEDLKSSFERFLANANNPGVMIYNNDDALLRELIENSPTPGISFGFTGDADFSASNIEMRAFGSKFDLLEVGFFSTEIEIALPGIHNVANALAAITLLIQLGLDPEEIKEPLSRFKGACRRLEVKWRSPELVVIDDYAHHPTEVKAAIEALKRMGDHVTVVFQPHRYSRTKFFYKEFGTAFDGVDDVILTEVYAAGESKLRGVGVDMIYDQINECGDTHARIMDKNKVSDYLMEKSTTGSSIVAFLGAGDIGEVANEFASRYKDFSKAEH